MLYYTPQILEQAGVGVLLSNLGISSDSASILISALTTLLMLPCIGLAMRLMDVSGRRSNLKLLLFFIYISSLILSPARYLHLCVSIAGLYLFVCPCSGLIYLFIYKHSIVCSGNVNY